MASSNTQTPITQLLQSVVDGDPRAMPEVISQVYAELRKIARGYMKRERSSHTLQPTALVNEAFLRLFQGKTIDWESRKHFYTVAARIMRHILIDHAKKKNAKRRGGGAAADVEFEENEHSAIPISGEPNLIALDEALKRLAEFDEKLCQVVELRYFGGLSIEEAAEVMECSTGTLKRNWNRAKAWLKEEMLKIEAA